MMAGHLKLQYWTLDLYSMHSPLIVSAQHSQGMCFVELKFLNGLYYTNPLMSKTHQLT